MILLKHNLQQECQTKGRQTKKAKVWLKQLSLGAIDQLELDQSLQQWELWSQPLETLDDAITERVKK